MRYNKNFKLVPIDDVSENLEKFDVEMQKVLHDPQMPDNTKAARYEDLMARLQNYRTQIGVTPAVRLESPPDIIDPPFTPPANMAVNYGEILQGLKSNSNRELVLNERVIPGSNFQDNLDYAEGLTDVVPYGYPQFVEHVQSKSTFPIRIPPIVGHPLKSHRKPRSKTHQTPKTPPRIVVTPHSNANTPVSTTSVVDPLEHDVTPPRRTNNRLPIEFDTEPVATATRQRQSGKGRQRLYIKLWKL